MEATHTFLRYARSFLAGTALSRISGLLRDVSMAISFGSSAELAGFFIAYRLSNLFRRILGEGNVQSGFVPHYLSLKEEGPLFYRDAIFSMGIILILTIIGLEALFASLRLFVPPDWQLILELSMWMAPGLFFICLYGMNSAFLQCRGQYFLPAAAPILFNFLWVAAALYLSDVRSMAIAVAFAFAVQWGATIFEGFKVISLKEWFKPRLFTSDFKALLKPLSLGLVGVGAVQFNAMLDPIFARFADERGPAFLWYAIRLQQLPFALFGLSLSNALLPALSRTESPSEKEELLNASLLRSSALMLFCTFAIFSLGGFGINFLYGHGDFSALDVENTLYCLWGYGLGLLPSVFVLLFSAKYYSEKNYSTPAFASLLSVIVNIALNTLFVFGFGWGAAAIAFATSIASLLNVSYLVKKALPKELWFFILKMSIACMAPAVLIFALQAQFMELYPRHLFVQGTQLAVTTAIYCAGVFLLCKWLKIDFRLERTLTSNS